MTSVSPEPEPSDPAAFRRQATALFQAFIGGLVIVSAGLVAFGYWVGGWWGLAVGVVLSAAILTVGLTGGGLLWAMTQDGA